jgi:hypothetical protein
VHRLLVRGIRLLLEAVDGGLDAVHDLYQTLMIVLQRRDEIGEIGTCSKKGREDVVILGVVVMVQDRCVEIPAGPDHRLEHRWLQLLGRVRQARGCQPERIVHDAVQADIRVRWS